MRFTGTLYSNVAGNLLYQLISVIAEKGLLILTFRRWTWLLFVPIDGLMFFGLAWMFKLLQSRQTETSVWHDRPFASTFLRPAYSLNRTIKVNVSPSHELTQDH